MIDRLEKEKCTGCTACYSVCPKECISMKEDSEGFLFPKIDYDQCIKCNQCEKACPVLTPTERNLPGTGFVVRSKVSDDVSHGTSGGFIPSLCEYILQDDGAVVAASYNKDFSVSHKLYNDLGSWNKDKRNIQGSKYVASSVGDSIRKLSKALSEGKKCIFIGTPCQVAGVKNALRKYSDNSLILVEFVCHGLPSDKVFRKYKEYQEKKYEANIESINFRYKKYGYLGSCMHIEFSNGKSYDGFNRDDLMLRSFFWGMSSRLSCYQCPMKNKKRAADITVFDSWHSHDLAPDSNSDFKGYTNVMLNTDKGITVWNKIKDSYDYYPSDVDAMIAADGIMIEHNPEMHPKRNEFLKYVDESGIDIAMRKVMPITIIDRLRIVAKKTVLNIKYGDKQKV